MATFTWKPNTDVPSPTDYLLERSVDNGLTWTAIVTVPHATPGVDYDTATGLFSFVDAGTVAGEIVRIQAVDSGDSSRDSTLRFNHAAAALPDTIHLFGTVIDAVSGEVRNGLQVRICPISETSSTFVPSGGSQETVPSITPQGLMGMKREAVVFTDDLGNWSVDMLRDLPVQIEIPAVKFLLRFRTPTDRDILNINDAYAYRIGGGEGTQVPYEFGAGSGFVT